MRPLFLLLAAALPVAAQADKGSDFFRQVSYSVVKIHASQVNGGLASGSGVVVGEGEVVTNCHVIRDAESITVVKGGLHVRVSGERVNAGQDLCLLSAPGLPLPPARLRSVDELKPGEAVYTYGYPGGAGAAFSAGEVTSLHRYDGSKVIESTAGFRMGSSGGALFDGEGRLLGITTFKARQKADHYYALPVDWIVALRGGTSRRVAPLDEGTPFWGLTAAEQPAFLRAVPLEMAADWPALARLADTWLAMDADNPEAWYYHARAAARLGSDGVATDSLRRAVDLYPGYAAAWYELGVIYMRMGDSARVEEVRLRLAHLDAGLAARFASETTLF